MSVLAALRRLFRRQRHPDHPLTEEERARQSEGFFEERAKALGPDGYDHVDVDREFRRPS